MIRILIVALALIGSGHQSLAGQDGASGVAVVPSLGFGAVVHNGRVESGGMSALLQVEVTQPSLRWGVFASVRGIGGGCSDGCDLSGQAVGLEASFRIGPVFAGAGLGAAHRFVGWSGQSHASGAVVVGSFRLQLRVEVAGGNRRLLVPLLLGYPLR